MAQKSLFTRNGYEGYKVSLRLIREGYPEYSPIEVACPEDVYDFMRDMQDFDRERFYSICLDAKFQVVHCEEVSSGTPTRVILHPREIFKSAILSSSSGIILAHNHPSGDPSPSAEDFAMTERVYQCGELMDVPLLDHLIIGTGSYYSFRNSGDLSKFHEKLVQHPPFADE